MRKITTLIINLLIAFCAFAQYPTNGLVGYYPLNSNAFDLSGNNRNPKETNAVLVPDRNGNPNAAYRFNNAAGHRIVFSLNEHPEFKVPTHTIAYWLKLDPNIPAGQFPTSVSIAGRTVGRVNIQSQNGFFRIENVGYRINEFITHQSGALQVNDFANNWVHIAITYDNTISNWRIFINGVSQVGLSYDANNTPGDLVYPGLGDSLMVFGTGPDFNNIRTLRGELDDVFIYNRRLSNAEIMQLMNYSTTAIPPSAPQITQHPESVTTCENSNLTLNVTANSFEPETYQWRKDGIPLSNNSTFSGVNTTSLTISNASNAQDGVYECIVSNSVASITSNPAYVNIVANANFDPLNGLVSYLPIKGPNYTIPLLGIYAYPLSSQLFEHPSLVADRFGNAASAAQFFGTGARIGISPAYNSNQGTFSFWYQHKFAFQNPRALLGSTLQTVNYLVVENDELCIINPASYKTGFVFNVDEWYHLTLRADGNNFSAYVNGIKVGEYFAPTITLSTFPLNKIGNSANNSNAGQPCVYDDFRMYNVALTDDEIANLANMPHFEQFVNQDIIECEGIQLTYTHPPASDNNVDYQWYISPNTPISNNSNISGATTNALSFNALQSSDQGTYFLEAVNECFNNKSFDIDLDLTSPNITIASQPQDVSICSNQSASMSVQTSGATPTGFQWKKDGVPLTNGGSISGANTSTLTISPAFLSSTGLYTVEILGSNCGTIESDFAVLNVASVPNATITPTTSPTICAGASINLSVPNAGAGATYAWSNGLPNNRTVSVSPNTTTTYSITITNAQNCSASSSRQVIVTPPPSQPTSTTPTANLNVCAGESTTLSANASGTVRWYANATGGPVLATGNTYTTPNLTSNAVYYAENFQNGCASNRISFNVTVGTTPSAPVNNTPSANLSVCSGSTTSLSVSSTSGTVEWFSSPTSTNVLATGNNYTTPALNTPGTTSYFVSSRFGSCISARTQINITVNQNPAAPINATQNLTVCNGGNIALAANASSGNQTINWYNAPIGGNIISTGGIYVTPALTSNTTFYAEGVSNSTGCSSPRTAFTITVTPTPAQPTSTTPVANLNVCAGENTILSANASGTVRWYSFANGGAILGTGNTFTTPNLSGSATYYAENFQNGCTSSRISFNVTVGTTPSAPVNNTPLANLSICSGSTTDLSVSSTSGTVEWFNSPTSTNVLAIGNNFTTPVLNTAGTTSYYVSASFGSCNSARTQISVSVNQSPGTPIFSTPTVNLTICSGQSATLAATLSGTNQTLNWYDDLSSTTTIATGSPFNTPILNTTTTFYYASQSNTNACESARTPITVNVNPIPTATVTPSNPEICEGDSVTLVASGGSLYNWNGTGFSSQNSITVAPNAFTTYSVIVRENNCNALASASVFVNSNPILSISPANPEICLGEDIQLSASGLGNFEWDNALGTNANITVEPTVNTTYSVTLTDANNCSSSASVSVEVNEVVASINGPSTICSGLDAILTASGGDTYVWSNGLGNNAAITVSPAATTTYEVTVTGAGGCTDVATQTVSVQSAPTAIISGQNEICLGESVVLEANGGNTYEWANGLGTDATITVSPSQTTTYSVTASIGVGCTADTSFTVVVNVPSSSQEIATICFGDSYDFEGTTYTTSGVYTATLTNAVNCDSTITLDLTVLPENSNNLDITLCDGTSFDFDGQTLTNGGNYSATFQDANNCDSTVNLTLNFVNEFLVTINESICEGESFEFDGQVLTDAGVYNATFASSGGCDSTVTLTLTTLNLPSGIVVTQNNATLSVNDDYDSYFWFNEADPLTVVGTGATFTATQNGNYYVAVYNPNGCSALSSTYNVTGLSIANLNNQFNKIYPNPTNGLLNLDLSDASTITIFNVTGNKVYQSETSAQNHQLNVSNYASGLYIIKTEFGVAKFVKE